MLAVADLIKARVALLAALDGWALRTGTELEDRRALPALDVRCLRATVADSRGAGAMVQPQWTVTLAVQRGPQAGATLDVGIAAVIETLHGWQPGEGGGRGWEAMKLADITEPIFADTGAVGYELTFTTAALYRGQQ
ncbi:MAG: hypothetical protein EOP24_26745 [Hyphomicrobiales bacterium]|nr:MAG: hypothetical protein EOP24_26745 [Hyphomicrobiales bacterium]